MSSLVHKGRGKGGWAKREVKAMRGADEDADGDAGAARGGGVDVGAACGACRGVSAARGMATVSEVPATEEG
jgi:hypothetical protein